MRLAAIQSIHQRNTGLISQAIGQLETDKIHAKQPQSPKALKQDPRLGFCYEELEPACPAISIRQSVSIAISAQQQGIITHRKPSGKTLLSP